MPSSSSSSSSSPSPFCSFSFAALFAIGSSILVSILLRDLPSPSSSSLVDPVAFYPSPSNSSSGLFPRNALLKQARKVGHGRVHGPEDMVVGRDGCMYLASETGWIQRLCGNSDVENWTFTGGRPLGLEWTPDHNLVVCDAYKGLLSVNELGEVEVLATEHGGRPFLLTDNADVSSQGIIYFTDASDKFNLSVFHLDFLEARPHGRLLSYHPDSKRVELLLDELSFANGVALSEKEDFLLVVETGRYRILRYWLKGFNKGTCDVFLDSLPGFPDNINSNRKGNFWVAFMKPRSLLVDILHPFPSIKRIIASIPKWILDIATFSTGFVFSVDENGTILKTLQDPWGLHINSLTGAREYQGKLYLTSLSNDFLGELDLELIQ